MVLIYIHNRCITIIDDIWICASSHFPDGLCLRLLRVDTCWHWYFKTLTASPTINVMKERPSNDWSPAFWRMEIGQGFQRCVFELHVIPCGFLWILWAPQDYHHFPPFLWPWLVYIVSIAYVQTVPYWSFLPLSIQTRLGWLAIASHCSSEADMWHVHSTSFNYLTSFSTSISLTGYQW